MTFPLTAQGAITGSLFVFVPSLGNFVIPELLGGGKTVMVGTLIRDQFLKAQNWPFGSTRRPRRPRLRRRHRRRPERPR